MLLPPPRQSKQIRRWGNTREGGSEHVFDNAVRTAARSSVKSSTMFLSLPHLFQQVSARLGFSRRILFMTAHSEYWQPTAFPKSVQNVELMIHYLNPFVTKSSSNFPWAARYSLGPYSISPLIHNKNNLCKRDYSQGVRS